MADETNTPMQSPETGTPAAAPSSGAGFLATTSGKIILAVVALVVLLIIIGAILAVFVFGGVSGLLNSGGSKAAPAAATPSVATTAAAVTAIPIVEPPKKPLTSSFTFRNVFEPSINPPVEASADTSSGSSTSSGSTNSADTLYLTDIVTTDSGRKGVFVWNGVTYTEGNGGVIDSSPWKVLEVGTDSVLMLYGDTQVTLSLGQGISK